MYNTYIVFIYNNIGYVLCKYFLFLRMYKCLRVLILEQNLHFETLNFCYLYLFSAIGLGGFLHNLLIKKNIII